MNMNLKELYRTLPNPLMDDDVFDALIQTYSQKFSFNSDYYDYLSRITTQSKGGAFYHPQDRDAFLSTAFNIWKHNVGEPLKTVLDEEEDATTMEDALSKLPAKKWMPYVENYLDEKHYWTYINSNDLHDNSTKDYPFPFDIEHRLYVNINTVASHKLGLLFLNKCEEKGLPYVFKFTDHFNRDDNFVIYTDTEHLSDYYDILTEIKKENPDLDQYISRPPILSGVVDGWIGYGSESYNNESSFNYVRSQVINSAFDDALKDAVFTNPELPIKIEDDEFSLIDEVAWRIVEKQVDYLQKLKKKDLKSYYGLKPRDLNKSKFLDNFFYQVKDHMLESIHQKSLKFEPFSFSYRNKGNSTIDIKSEDFQRALLSAFPDLLETYKGIKEMVRNTIIERGKEKGIDGKNFAFDSYVVDNLIKGKAKKALHPVSDEKFHAVIDERGTTGYKPVTRITKSISESKDKRDTKKSKESTATRKEGSTQTKKEAKTEKIDQKPVNKKKPEKPSTTSATSMPKQIGTSLYNLKKNQIIQDLPINSNQSSRYQGMMSEEEIRQSRIKLGFISPDIQPDTTYRLKKDQIIQDLPINSKEPSRYQGRMSDEEIRQSRIKLGFISPDVQPDTTYRLKKEQIIQDLPIYSKEPSRYQGRMTEEEIKGAQKKIGVYKK